MMDGLALPVTPPAGNGAAPVRALITAAGERAAMRFLEFFAANIRNPHTRRACRPNCRKLGDDLGQAKLPLVVAGVVHG